MELEFGKHFKDATNLLLMMDHDSGYVEGVESYTSSSNESDTLKEVIERPLREPVNFFLNEDALLEKPDVVFNLGSDLPYEIDTNDYEESRKLFPSPEVVSSSVPSQNSTATMIYSGLENDTSSDMSNEIALAPSIVIDAQDTVNSNDICDSDMSLEQSFDPVIIEKSMNKYHDSNCSISAPITDNKEKLFNNCAVDKNDDWSISSIPLSETPSKSNPLAIVTNTFQLPSSNTKRKLTLVFSKSEKENLYSVKRKYPSITPEKTIPHPIDSNISPDIFDNEMIDNETSYFRIQTQDSSLEEKYVDKLDQKLLKKIQRGMNGVLPPPSMTVIHLSANDNDSSLNSSFNKSLLLSVDVQEAKSSSFSEAFNMRCHGLHYNCGKISEEIVDLCDKYQKRFVGAETQSTCTVFEMQHTISPSKRRMMKSKWGGKSPGRRLSHLARRRITFSSANLQAGGSSLAGSRARQILVDAKKMDLLNRRKSPRKSPWNTRQTPRKTPNKSPKAKTRTPSSSAKKKLAMRFRKLTGEFENSLPSTSEQPSVHKTIFRSPNSKSEYTNRSTKRALFRSPCRDSNSSLFSAKSQDSFEERNNLRRALFTSPRKGSPLKGKKSPFRQFGFEKKRKRSESDDAPPSKFPRSMSMDVKPSTSSTNKSFSRTQSELNISLTRSQSQNELSEQQKKKLLWAVSGALQSQNIISTNPQWKVYASVLARVTRRFFISQMAANNSKGAKLEGGTTERMNRIARYHVISVIKGKSVDEIINEYAKNKVKVQRPRGYVAPEEFTNPRIIATSGAKENVFQDRANTMESWEKKKCVQGFKQSTTNNKIERIRKVINFGDDR